MGSNVKYYDPDQFDTIVGTVALSGFAENEMVMIEEDAPLFTIKKGVDGDVSRSKNLARTALVTVKLMSTSQSNAYLSGLALADLAASGGAGVIPILLRDRNGTSVFATDTCWIEERPKPSKANEATVNEWKLRCVGYVFFEGGT